MPACAGACGLLAFALRALLHLGIRRDQRDADATRAGTANSCDSSRSPLTVVDALTRVPAEPGELRASCIVRLR